MKEKALYKLWRREMISNYFCEYDSSGYVCMYVMFYFHRICKCWIHGKEDTDEKESLFGTTKDGRTKEKWGYERK